MQLQIAIFKEREPAFLYFLVILYWDRYEYYFVILQFWMH